MNDHPKGPRFYLPSNCVLSLKVAVRLLVILFAVVSCTLFATKVRATPIPKSEAKDRNPKENKSDLSETLNDEEEQLEEKAYGDGRPTKGAEIPFLGGGEAGGPRLEAPTERNRLGQDVDAEEEEYGEESPPLTIGKTPPSVPLLWTNEVKKFLDYFQESRRHVFSQWLARSSQYVPSMKEILRENGLPEDLVYLALIESGFNLKAHSPAEAWGPWQIIADTGRRYGLRINRWIDERLDPIKSTQAASKYLKEMYDMFDCWLLTQAGYNAGENRVLRAIKKTDNTDFWYLARNGYLPPETRNYVPKFMAATIIAKDPEKFGFMDLEYRPPFLYEEVAVPGMTPLKRIARWSNASYEEIKRLNPELKLGLTPPNYPNYKVKIPRGSKEILRENMVAYLQEQSSKEEDRSLSFRWRKARGKRGSLALVKKKGRKSGRRLATLRAKKRNKPDRTSLVAGAAKKRRQILSRVVKNTRTARLK
ncbi:MAG: lytic transglycosylase domain-containing protein [Nitrospinae bacterium]|nr:lytic transglycosylase domain-containing protein [Nitrospinota bacterium]